MKTTKSVLLAALAALSIGSASADTQVIYITGSTAFRGIVNTAISALANTGVMAGNKSSIAGSGDILFNNTNGSTTNIIVCHWSGSEAGIQNVAGPSSGAGSAKLGFYPTNATGGLGSAAVANNYQNAQITFADTYQSTSVFTGTYKGISYTTLTDTPVAIVTFSWIGSTNIPATTITPQTAQNVLAAGSINLALLTGLTADQTNGCYLVGRNADSGTRITTFLEAGFGAQTVPTQYAVGTSYTLSTNNAGGTGATNITATFVNPLSTNHIITYPAETINGLSFAAGASGYSSGGTICGLMSNAYALGAGLIVDGGAGNYAGSNFIVSYAGEGDIQSTVPVPTQLKYCGVPFSQFAVKEGNYTFWSTEHCLKSPSASAGVNTFYTTLTGALLAAQDVQTGYTGSFTLWPNVALANMLVGRTGDGAVVSNTGY